LPTKRTVEENRRTAGLKFECTECGKCCTRRGKYAHVYVTDEDVRGMAELRGLSVRSFRRRFTFTDELGWTQIRFDEHVCPFLDVTTNRCTVYEARPVQCRTFPFWDEMVDEHGWTESARTLCEGLDRGTVHRREDVEAAMRAMRESD